MAPAAAANGRRVAPPLPASLAKERCAGGSLQRLRADLFDAAGVKVAISSCLYAVDSMHNSDLAAALARDRVGGCLE